MKKEFYFEDLTTVLLNDYITYCYSTLKNKNNTVQTNIRSLMKFYNDAIAEDVVHSTSILSIKSKPKRFFENKISPKEEIELLKNTELKKEV